MNVLYIHTHDTGRFIQPYGYQTETPNLLNFAKQGTVFRSAFCAAPTCSPSRAALLTGQYPHSCKMFGLAHRGFQMEDYAHHMAFFFRTCGYETILCGIQHEAPQAKMIGYSRILDDQSFDMGCLEFDSKTFDERNANQVSNYLMSQPEKPFFLSYGLFSTHRDYPYHDDDINPGYVMAMPGLPDCHDTRKDTAAYLSSVRNADRAIGSVLQTLKSSGLSENTLVIYTTDHGLALPGMKCTLYDYGISVSMMIDYPSNPSKKTVYDSLVSQIDLFPTLCDICGLEKPDWLQGVSLLPILEQKTTTVREEVFSEVTFHVSYEPMRAVRTQRYKLIHRFDSDLAPALANIDDSPFKTVLLEQGCLLGDHARIELYDLYQDPGEKYNLAENPAYKATLQGLTSKLMEWMEETNDPLLSGPIQPPPKAVINPKSDHSPKKHISGGSYEKTHNRSCNHRMR